MLVVTIALIGKTYVLAQIEGVGSNIVYATYSGGTANARSQADEISLNDMEAVRHLPHVVEVAGTSDMATSIVVNGQETAVALVGVTEGFQKIRNLLILEGRFFDDLDQETDAKGCLITQELAKKLPPGPMIGRQLHVGEQTFTIIAVFRERVATFGQSEIGDLTVLIPFRLMKYYSGVDYIRTLYAQADSGNERAGDHTGREGAAEEPPRAGRSVYGAEPFRDSGRGAQNQHRADCGADAGGHDRPDHQRRGHYEHHAGNGDRAHPRDWVAEGDWRPPGARFSTSS